MPDPDKITKPAPAVSAEAMTKAHMHAITHAVIAVLFFIMGPTLLSRLMLMFVLYYKT
jgi:hypothetical protein